MKATFSWISVIILLAMALSLPGSPAQVVEARPLVDAIPGVSMTLPATGMLGEPVTLLLEFDNIHAADVGYGPYMDLFLPLSGPDGVTAPAVNDGLTMTGASYLGGSITNQILLCPAGSIVTHPLTNLPVNCPAAPGGFATPFTWQMVVFTLPFGSFVADQPPATVTITLDMSDYADLGTPLPVYANGGFMFGNDPLNNPATDPVIIGATVSASITPTLIELVKTYNGPEDETATGPNFPRSYTIDIDIAENQTVTNLDVIDELDNNQEYLGFANATPAPYSVVDLPGTPGPQNPPDNDLDIRFNSVAGGTGTGDASLDVLFYIPQYDADGNYIIGPQTGDDVLSCNNARTVGDWTPLDPRDVGGTDNAISNPAGCEHELEDQSIAIQKTVQNLTDANHSPGDVLEYTLQFQISDYFAFEGIDILDTFSDGQLFDTTFTPTLSLIEHGTPTAGGFVVANYTVFRDSPGTGETEVAFNVSAELIARSLDGQISGGCVPAGGTGGGDPNCSLYNGGASTGVVVFRTIIQENFTDSYLPGDPSVDQGDILWNDVVIDGNVLNVANLVWNGNTEDDDSHAEVTIARGTLDKSIYALNGIIPAPTPVRVAPGDTVTFRLRYAMPNSDFEDFYVIDYLPLPVFDAFEVSGPFNNTICGVPAAGSACLGPADSYHLLPAALVPTLAVDTAANSVRFDYGDYDILNGVSSVVDILFTVTVEGDPFADGLFLTNQARASEGSTNNGFVVDDDIEQIILTEPVLSIAKGVVATNNPGGVFIPLPVAPTAFTAPGGACPRFTPTISSSGLAANPINSNLSGVDAADRVTFAIVIANTGSGLTGAFDVRFNDTLPTGFAIPGTGLNLCVTNGAGTALPYTDLGGGLFGTGLELTDPATGALAAYDANNGQNILIVTYDLELTGAVEPLQTLTNTATLFNYAGLEGGTDHTATDLTNDATVTTAPPAVTKLMTGTNQPFTTDPNVAIGEIVTYQVTVRVPEGTTSNVTIRDILDPGLAFMDCTSVTASAALSSSIGAWSNACNPGTNPTIGPEPVGSPAPADQGRRVIFDFDTITNTNTDNATAEIITLTYRAVVLNALGNNRGVARNNAATFIWDGGSVGASAPDVVIVEPTITIQKDALPTTGDAGDVITFTIIVRNQAPSNTDGFNLNWTDIIPAQMTYVAGTFTNTAGLAPTTISDAAAPTLTASWDTFALGQTSTLTFQATLGGTVIPGQTITNTATQTWTSLPGGVGTPQSPFNPLSCERTGNPADCGGAENDYTSSDPAIVIVYAPAPSKSIIQTSESHTGNPGGVYRLAVGEVARYRLVVRLAETTMADLYLMDALGAGLQFLDDGTARAAFVCSGGAGCITSSNPLIASLPVIAGDETTLATITPTFALPDDAVSRLLPSDDDAYGNGTDFYVKFSQVQNNDRDTNQEFLVVEFNAVAMDVIGNQNNTALNNSFNLYINGALNASSATITARVAEPNFVLTKTATTIPTDAGDTVVYTIVATNNSGILYGDNAAAGFDLNLQDTLDANLILQSVGVTVPAYATYTDSSAAPTVNVLISRINPGDSVTITVTARVAPGAFNGQTIPNLARLTYTSLPGSNGTCPNLTGSCTPGTPGSQTGERDGVTAPLTTNNYAVQANANVTLATPVFDKLTPVPAAYTIGDIVTYNLLATLPEGTTQGLVIYDNLPVGLQYVSHSLITTAAASGGLLPADYAGAAPAPVFACAGVCGSGDDVTFTFGDQVTADDNIANTNAFIIRIQAQVIDLFPGNVDGALPLPNSAELRYTNPNTGATVILPDGPEYISIIEPRIETLKTVIPTSGVQAGDTLTYTVRFTNTGHSPAYDVTAMDTLAQGISFTALTGCSDGTLAVPSQVTAGPGVNQITFDGVPAGSWDIAVNAYIECTYTALAEPDIYIGSSHINVVDADWSTQDGGAPVEREYDDTTAYPYDDTQDDDDASFTVDALTFDKSDNGALTATIGETIHYTLTLSSPLGTIRNLTITDALPQGLIYDVGTQAVNGISTVPTFAVSTPNDGTAPVTLTWTFGDAEVLSTPVTVTFTATVANVIGNQQGDNVLNSATLTHDDAAGVPQPPLTADDDFVIVEPVLDITKNATYASPIDAGDTVAYQVVVTNPGGTNVSTAYNVQISDTLPADITLNLPVTITLAGGATGAADLSTGNTVDVSVAEIPVGGSVTIDYTAVLLGSVTPGDTITNAVWTRWTSLPGTPTEERNGSQTPPLNDYYADDGLVIPTGGPALSKILETTSAGHTSGSDVTIGEVITYAITVTLPEGTTPAVTTVVDGLPDGLAYVAGSGSVDLTVFGGTVDMADPAITSAGGSGDDVIFTFNAPISIDADNDPTNNSFILRLDALVLNILDNQNGDGLINNATLTIPGNNPITTPDVPATVVEPELDLTKSVSDATPGINQTITFTLGLEHLLSSTADAMNVVVTDTLPTGLTLDLPTVAVVATPVGCAVGVDTSNSAGSTIDVRIAQLPLGCSAAITFDAVVSVPPLTLGDTLINDAHVEWSSLSGVDPNERDGEGGVDDYFDDASAGITVEGIDLTLTKDDGGATTAPGGVVVYTLNYANVGNQGATGVVITDSVPLNTTFNAAGSTAGWSCADGAPAGTVCSFTVGALAVGASGSVNFAVLVDDPLPAGVTQIDNTALIGDDNTHGDDPTPGDNQDDDQTPVDATPDLTITKDDGGVTTAPGGVVVYTLNYANVGNQDATGVIITDTVPLNTTFDLAGSTAGWSCADNDPAGTVCTLSLGTVGAGTGGSVAFAVQVDNPLPAGVDEIDNTTLIADDGANGTDPTPGDNQDDDQTPVDAAPDLTITKDDGGVTTTPGGVVIYTFNYANVGNQDATGVIITDTVPLNTTFNAAGSTAGWSCADGDPAGTVCSFTVGALAVGDSGSVNFAVQVDDPLPAGVDEIDNTTLIADDGANGTDPTPGDNQDDDQTPVDAAPDLTITKDDGSVTTTPGGVVVYTLNYANVGNQDATGVVITDNVPMYTTFDLAGSTAGWSCADGDPAGTVCSFTVGALAVGDSGSVNFAVQVDNPLPAGVDEIDNTALIADDGANGTDPTPGDNQDDDQTPVDAAPDLTITKDDGGATTSPGGVLVYTLNYANVGNQGATGVVITDTVPLNTTFNASGSTAGWSCVDGDPAGTPCTFTVGALAAGASGSVNFAVLVNNPLPAGVTQIDNTALIGDDGANGDDPTPGDNQDDDQTPVDAVPDLTITKDDGGVTTAPGGVVVYTLNYANVGNQGATGVVITDTVPLNTTFNAAGSTAGWSCADGDPAGAVCSFTVGALAVGASGSVNFAVLVDDPLPAGVTEIDNAALIGDDGANGDDPTPGDNQDDDQTPVDAVPDLTITKDDGGATTIPGGVVVYTLNYANVGNQDATGVVITDTVPQYTTFDLAGSTAGWSCADNDPAGTVCTLPLGTLAAGSSGSAAFAVQVDASLPDGITQIENTALIDDDGSNGDDPTPGNNEDDDDTPTTAAPDLNILKDDGGGSTVPGAVVIYTLTYANVGNQDATGVVITDMVPLHTTFDLAGSTAGWSCVDGDPAGTVCTYAVGNLAAGASGSIAFAVQVDNPLPEEVTEILNTALIADDGSNGDDPTPGDNQDDDDTPTTAAPDLSITKDDGQTVVGPGVTLTYTLTISNIGNQTATGVLVTDTLPTLTSFVSASDGGTEAAGVVTWPTFTLAAGQTVTRTVTVQVALEVPEGETSLLNLGTVVDDGTNGEDPDTGNNEDEDEDQLITIPNEGLSKVLAGSSEPTTPDPNVAIGEIITYQVSMSIPVGSLEDMTLIDTLDRGLAFQDCASITASSPDVTTDVIGGFAGVCNTAAFSASPAGSLEPVNQGRVMTLDFGNVSNTSTEEAVLTVRYTVVVLDNAENLRGVSLDNHVVWRWDSGMLDDIADPVVILEPDLALTKTVDPDMALPGEAVTFTLTIAHTDASNQDAWDVIMTDIVPSQLIYVPGSLVYVSGQQPTLLDASLAPTLRIRYNQFLNNDQPSIVQFRARLGNLPAGSTVTNTASLSWTSLPGNLIDPRSDYNEYAHERFYDPDSSVDIYGTTSSASITVPELPATGFAPGRVTVLPESADAQPYAELGDIWLEIPRFGVSVPIVGVPVKNSEWDLTWLANQVGWLEGTAYPTWVGNSALTGHVYDANGLPGPFNRLGSLAWGDQIIVHIGNEQYIYEVRSVRQTLPTDSSVLRHEDRAWLTLITCKGYDQDTNAYQLRVAVKAVLLRVEGK